MNTWPRRKSYDAALARAASPRPGVTAVRSSGYGVVDRWTQLISFLFNTRRFNSTLRLLFFGDGRKRDERTNGRTHIGGWVENVTNGQTDKHT